MKFVCVSGEAKWLWDVSHEEAVDVILCKLMFRNVPKLNILINNLDFYLWKALLLIICTLVKVSVVLQGDIDKYRS